MKRSLLLLFAFLAPAATAAGPPTCPTDMRFVPSATVMLGVDEPGAAANAPGRRRRVAVDPFCLDTTEVAVGSYARCVETGQCKPINGCNTSRPTHPMTCVSYADATAYCRSVDKRLPTADEWEYAARGSDERPYPWGKAAPKQQPCWESDTCPVGSHPLDRSPFGILDLGGNVSEWTATLFYTETVDSPEAVRQVCGADWYVTGDRRVTRMFSGKPDERNEHLGFRCARTPR